MARPLEFDRDAAREAALKLFWCQGYAATSLQQLLDAMAIGRSSFYAAFGDKRELFIEIVALFRDRTIAILEQAREELGPSAAIPEFFRHTVLGVPARRVRRGCLMVNTLLELADVDDELSRFASDSLDQIEHRFAHYLEEAQQAGEMQERLSPGEAARQLMLINQGLRVASRQGHSRPKLAAALNTSLRLLGLPAAA